MRQSEKVELAGALIMFSPILWFVLGLLVANDVFAPALKSMVRTVGYHIFTFAWFPIGIVVIAVGSGMGRREERERKRRLAYQASSGQSSADDQMEEERPLPRGTVRCYSCGNVVRPQKHVGPVVIVFFLAGILPALFYAAFAPKRCPNCRAKL